MGNQSGSEAFPAIVQARMSSRRLPGKVLLPLAGRPLLARVLDRLALCREISAVAVATSVDAGDDPVETFCRTNGVRCLRGPLEDVVQRFLDAAQALSVPFFVRISADSPFMDPRVVDRGVRVFRAAPDTDLVTNVFPRSYPKGQSVEVLRVEALRRAGAVMTDPADREHVTRYFYEHPEQFRIVNFSSGADAGMSNLCVDTPGERLLAEKMWACLDQQNGFSWEAALAVQQECRNRQEEAG